MQNPRAAAAADAAVGVTASGQATGSTPPSISDRFARIASVRPSRRTLARPCTPAFSIFFFPRFSLLLVPLAPLLIVVLFPRRRLRKRSSSLRRHAIVLSYTYIIRRYAITIITIYPACTIRTSWSPPSFYRLLTRCLSV